MVVHADRRGGRRAGAHGAGAVRARRLAGDLAVWHMPRADPPTIYLTYDDGPNPATTPDLLDVLTREEAAATFFLIDRHLTEETRADRPAHVCRRPCRRAALGVARATCSTSPPKLAQTLTGRGRSDRIARRHTALPRLSAARRLAGRRRCTRGCSQIDYKLVGWGWMLWDFNWFRRRTADSTVARVGARASAGDIVVMHDGDESAPDRRPAADGRGDCAAGSANSRRAASVSGGCARTEAEARRRSGGTLRRA